MLFEAPQYELTDEEIAEVLRQAMCGGSRLSRMADLYLAGLCAEHLVEHLRASGLRFVRPALPAAKT